MRPEARIAAAAEILDDILSGEPAERRLTRWARASRFAGSGDRNAIRDLVFDALRRRRSLAWIGGAETGRGLMIGAVRASGAALETVFTGERFAPGRLTDEEQAAGFAIEDAPEPVRLDCPEWLWPDFVQAYGEVAAPILAALRERAPVFLRVNALKATCAEARELLAADGIRSEPHPLAATALLVIGNARSVRASRAYLDGVIEMQDAASQAVVERCLPFAGGGRVLDYCAGGGGKALALAGAGVGPVVAHDAAPERMKDIPARAARAGATIRTVTRAEGLFELVLCDAPCSGSGAWRRQPDAKWTLDAAGLDRLNETQDAILDMAQHHVAHGGALAYATCSLLPAENGQRVDAFLARNPEWRAVSRTQWTPLDGGDGFYLAILQKS